MTEPLALVLYEKLMPGSQLVNRLQDLKYRVVSITDATALVPCAQQERPMLIIADLVSSGADVASVIARLRQTTATEHIPVIAFGPDEDGDALREAARKAGATLAVTEAAILNHLPQFLNQALEVE
jgi:PleD family two-component response regulator